ncbi:hypothetical protein HHX48_17675 [Salinimonas sp. HHU 13199]|uniref:DUF4124 domain-containing protein n=1 Tax=Salinimonas profundi TaxID=2729140 RepID=A0ABR8LR91_9ALTE|nr:hypothetical protein [Salinimonas profundi]MBD3587571.1 hypothetical protein [Salinimonas profundi]
MKLGIICALVLTNSYLVFQYAQDKFSLPDWLDEIAQSSKDAVITAIDSLATKPMPAKLGLAEPAKQLAPVAEVPSELAFTGASCLDKRKATQSKRIFTWTDSHGIQHISDKPRRVDDGTPVTLVSNIHAKDLSINFLGLQGSYNLKQKIITSVNASKTLFEQVVPAELVKPLTVNFRLFTDKSGYEMYRGPATGLLKNSQGFYRAGTNESVVWVKNEAQGEKTAVHEAMHSINRHYIGQMSKWLNEGLAEVAEDIANNPSVLRSTLRSRRLLPVSDLLNSIPEQWAKDSSTHYRTAKALVSYLYFTDRTALTRLLLAESENGCETLQQVEVTRIIGKDVRTIDAMLKRWLS